MHTCSMIQWLLLSWRYGPSLLFLILLPFSCLVVLSTLYLNYHYAIDVFAGGVLAFLTYGYMKKFPLTLTLSIPYKIVTLWKKEY